MQNRVISHSPVERILGHELTLRPTLFTYSITIFEGLLTTSFVHPGGREAMAQDGGDTAGEAAYEGKERLRVPTGKVVET